MILIISEVKILPLQIKLFIRDAKFVPGKVTKVEVVLHKIIKLKVSMENQLADSKKAKFILTKWIKSRLQGQWGTIKLVLTKLNC